MGRFRIIVAGCGGMSKAWLEYAKARPDAGIAGLVDVRRENAEKRAAEFGLAVPCFTDIRDALAALKPNLVMDVTVPETHGAVTRAALAAGCDVLGEKPMAATLEDARASVREAARTGRTYAVMQNRRYLKGIRGCRDLVRKLGAVGIVNADFYIGAHFGGFRDLMEHPLILDMAIHTFDQARFLCGADAVSAYCQESSPAWSWYAGAACAVCIFEMSNGAVFTYRGSWCAEGAGTPWEAEWRIVGSQGTVIWPGREASFADLVSPATEPQFIHPAVRVDAVPDWPGREGHPGCLDEMFSALVEGRKAETDCTDNIKSMEMVFAAVKSSRQGRKIPLP